MHTQVALARQELEAEKLTNHHLKAEVESYRLVNHYHSAHKIIDTCREIVDHNQKAVSTLRKELTAVKAIMNSVEALRSIQNIPGSLINRR